MQKDIKEMLRNYKDQDAHMTQDHQHKFEQKLMKELHRNTASTFPYKWLSIAASIALLVTLTYGYLNGNSSTDDPIIPQQKLSLGTISPELNSIETYYVNSINYELSQLELTDDNKELLDGYLEQLGELTKEYKSLTEELNTKGVNDATIDALISNLQLRLQLLKRLKKQMNDFKKLNPKQNETQFI